MPGPAQGNLFPPAVELGSRRPAGSDPVLQNARRKILWLVIACLFWAGAIFVRLVYLQVVRREFFEERARAQQQRTVEVLAGRGLILDRRGQELAVSMPVDSICAMRAEISDPEGVADILSPILGLERDELVRKLAVGRGFCWIQRMADPELAERVRALNLRGIYFQKESKRFYPKGKTAAHLIGVVGLDQVGLAGIEQAKDDELDGRPGLKVVSTDARQRYFEGRFSQEPEPGLNIMLTIDERIQYVAERELNRAVSETGAQAGSIVVLEPATGAVLAMANHPTFDPNRPVRTKTREELEQELENRRNYAVSSSFEPGSTFKLVTIAAALEENLTRPDEVLDCQMGSIVVGGQRIRDHKPFGYLTVGQILANSSGVGTIKLGMRLGERRLYQYIRRFGFGRPTGVGLPGEAAGLTKPAERWSKVSIGAISMGQEIGVTAIQLVQAVGAIANNGILVHPRLIEATFENGAQPAPVPRGPGLRVISQETALHMKRMMEMVVLNGTGKLARLEGYTAGGKTGTAQKIDPRTGAYSKKDYVASFVGLAPLNNPAVVVAVILDSPRGLHSGGGVAAPVFPRVAGEALRYLKVPQEIPVDPALRKKRARPDAALLAEVTDFTPDNGLTSQPEPALLPDRGVERDFVPVRREDSRPTVLGVSQGGKAPVPDAPPPLFDRPAPSQVVLAVASTSVPDFHGKPLRSVVEQATSMGLRIEPRGSGLARWQSPPPGSPVPAGTRVVVDFER